MEDIEREFNKEFPLLSATEVWIKKVMICQRCNTLKSAASIIDAIQYYMTCKVPICQSCNDEVEHGDYS